MPGGKRHEPRAVYSTVPSSGSALLDPSVRELLAYTSQQYEKAVYMASELILYTTTAYLSDLDAQFDTDDRPVSARELLLRMFPTATAGNANDGLAHKTAVYAIKHHLVSGPLTGMAHLPGREAGAALGFAPGILQRWQDLHADPPGAYDELRGQAVGFAHSDVTSDHATTICTAVKNYLFSHLQFKQKVGKSLRLRAMELLGLIERYRAGRGLTKREWASVRQLAAYGVGLIFGIVDRRPQRITVAAREGMQAEARRIKVDVLLFAPGHQLGETGLAKTQAGSVGMLQLIRELMIYNENVLAPRGEVPVPVPGEPEEAGELAVGEPEEAGELVVGEPEEAGELEEANGRGNALMSLLPMSQMRERMSTYTITTLRRAVNALNVGGSAVPFLGVAPLPRVGMKPGTKGYQDNDVVLGRVFRNPDRVRRMAPDAGADQAEGSMDTLPAQRKRTFHAVQIAGGGVDALVRYSTEGPATRNKSKAEMKKLYSDRMDPNAILANGLGEKIEGQVVPYNNMTRAQMTKTQAFARLSKADQKKVRNDPNRGGDPIDGARRLLLGTDAGGAGPSSWSAAADGLHDNDLVNMDLPP